MADDDAQNPNGGGPDNGGRRRRRRRRRRGGGREEEGVRPEGQGPGGDWGDDLLLSEGEDGDPRPAAPAPAPSPEPGRRRRPPHGGNAQDFVGPVVNVPTSGKNPSRKRTSRVRRTMPGSAAIRRRRLHRIEVTELTSWLERCPEALVASLYRGLGGQPDRIGARDRMIQLAARAVSQGSRLGAPLKQLHERDRKSLAALLSAGGLAHADELHRELTLAYGGHDREWSRSLHQLAERGLVFATHEIDGAWFYVVPEALYDTLAMELADELRLPVFDSPDVRIMEHRPFCPPLDFSITTLATYIDQHHPRLTQRHEIHRHDLEAMDAFFSQLWETDSELFAFHLDFLMMHGLIELRGEYLSLNRDAMEEWLQLEPEDQRDLLFVALNKRAPQSEWVLWAIHEAGNGWVAERPLATLYRRWRRGDDWRDRFARGQFGATRTSERESFSFAGLVRTGLLEMGQWGQEKFYRLSPRGKQLLEPPEDEGFRQFYLTPSFEVMAPAGLAPILLFRIGEIAELVGCDRANTYRINEGQVQQALDRGWRRDDILQFLRDNSQIGVPDNVEQTLKGWIGHRGDVEFHDLLLMTVHRSQIRRLESNKRIKPYVLHRFAPGMYAVDRHRVAEIEAVLREGGFDPSKDHRRYPGDPDQVEARQQLHRLVAEARESAIDPAGRTAELVQPEKLHAVPGTRLANLLPDEPEELPGATTPEEIRSLLEKAMQADGDVEMVYLAKTGQKLTCKVHPERIAFKSEAPVLVGLDKDEKERRTFLLERIERLRLL